MKTETVLIGMGALILVYLLYSKMEQTRLAAEAAASRGSGGGGFFSKFGDFADEGISLFKPLF